MTKVNLKLTSLFFLEFQVSVGLEVMRVLLDLQVQLVPLGLLGHKDLLDLQGSLLRTLLLMQEKFGTLHTI
jgi:hypothetical protein